jgi:hypothetical protein
MQYGNEPSPREETIKRIELADTVVAQHVESIREFAALTTSFPEQFRSSLIFEYAYHSVVYALKNSVQNFFPGWLYMEHAAAWMHQALSQPLSEPEYQIDEDEFLTRIVFEDQETNTEHELAEMQHLYQLLEYMDESHRWQMLFNYAHRKYVRSHIFETSPLREAAEIVMRFRAWQQQQGGEQ